MAVSKENTRITATIKKTTEEVLKGKAKELNYSTAAGLAGKMLNDYADQEIEKKKSNRKGQ